MPLTKAHVTDICLWNENDHTTCRYCAQDDFDSTKFYCIKQSAKKAIADSEVQDYLKKMKSSGQDPNKQGYPLGDNCQGYPIMQHIDQGYDKDK